MRVATTIGVGVALLTGAVVLGIESLDIPAIPEDTGAIGSLDAVESDATSGPIERVSDVLAVLRERGLVTETDDELADRLVRALLEGARLEQDQPAADEATGTPPDGLPSIVKGPWMLRGSTTTTYLNVVSAHSDFLDVFRGEAGGEHNASSAQAMVIDLREADGTGRRADFSGIDGPQVLGDRLCAGLIGPQTTGGAELLAGTLAGLDNAILVGQPTRGQPYPTVELPVTDALTVAIPVRPANTTASPWPPRPLQPDLHLSLTDEPYSVKGDACPSPEQIAADIPLRRALDMMRMAVALGELEEDDAE